MRTRNVLVKSVILLYMTHDYGVEVEFDQSSCVSHCDENIIERKLGHVGKIQEIMQVDFSMSYF